MLLFSVDGSRKYHGYAELVLPDANSAATAAAADSGAGTVSSTGVQYHPTFGLRWIRAYEPDSVQGLSFQVTRDLMLQPTSTTPADGAEAASTPAPAATAAAAGKPERNVAGSINMARNGQEIHASSAQALLARLDADLDRINAQRKASVSEAKSASALQSERAFFRSDSEHPNTLLQGNCARAV